MAVVGAGGIGFDVAEFLTHEPDETLDAVDGALGRRRPARCTRRPDRAQAARRRPARSTCSSARRPPIGTGLGKTIRLDAPRGAQGSPGSDQVAGATYDRIDDAGLHLTVDGTAPVLLEVDNVVLCAGQESVRGLYDDLRAADRRVHLIGGADVAAELDAKRAIKQGTRVAAAL